MARKATYLELDGISRCYVATVAGSVIHHHALPVVSLRLRRGEWVAVRGGGPGPLTLLRCAAGLVPPDTGRVRWLDDGGREVARPRTALVHADQAPYACWTVRDAIWGAVAPRVEVTRATGRVAFVLRCCGLEAVAPRRVVELGALDGWRVGVAAAVAGGARWLFLELPPLDRAAGVPAGGPAGGPQSASLAAVRRMGESLAALGVGALVAGEAAVPFALDRQVTLGELVGPGEWSAYADGVLARVAEFGGSGWKRAGTGVASPTWPA